MTQQTDAEELRKAIQATKESMYDQMTMLWSASEKELGFAGYKNKHQMLEDILRRTQVSIHQRTATFFKKYPD